MSQLPRPQNLRIGSQGVGGDINMKENTIDYSAMLKVMT